MSEEIFLCPEGFSNLHDAMYNVTIATIDDMNCDTKCRRDDASTTFRAKHQILLYYDEPSCWSSKLPLRKKRSIFSGDISHLEDGIRRGGKSSSRNVSIYDRDLCLVDSVGLAARDIFFIFFCAVLPPPDVLHRSLVT